jgi:hypothetical protein
VPSRPDHHSNELQSNRWTKRPGLFFYARIFLTSFKGSLMSEENLKTVFLFYSRQCQMMAGYSTADIPGEDGPRQVCYTEMTTEPEAGSQWPDNRIVWQGAREDVRNIRAREPMSGIRYII